MARMNINAGAQGNPLDALLNGRPMYGNAGGMLYTQGGNGPDAFNTGGYAPDGSTPSDVLTTDPRYFSQTTTQGSEAGGGDRVYRLNPRTQQALKGRVQIRNTNIGGPGGVIDPSQVEYDPEFGLVTDPRNLNAVGETFLDKYGPWMLAAPAAIAAGGAIAAGVGEGAGGAGAAGISGSNALATGGFGTNISAGSGAFGGVGAAGATGGAASSGLPDSYWNQYADSGQIGSDAGYDMQPPLGDTPPSPYEIDGLGPDTLPTGSASGATFDASGNLIPAGGAAGGSAAGAAGGTAGGTAGSAGGSSGILSQLGLNSPTQIARAGLGLYALGSAHTGTSGANTSGAAGSLTDPMSIINAMASANRVNQNTPFGSRTWSQDPTTGQWTVNDTMNPTEQANYTNVAGMNTDLTNFARQRLAALMAAPASARADRPISFMQHSSGG